MSVIRECFAPRRDLCAAAGHHDVNEWHGLFFCLLNPGFQLHLADFKLRHFVLGLAARHAIENGLHLPVRLDIGVSEAFLDSR